MSKSIRIGNCSGFYGDRLAAAKEMIDGGPIDVQYQCRRKKALSKTCARERSCELEQHSSCSSRRQTALGFTRTSSRVSYEDPHCAGSAIGLV